MNRNFSPWSDLIIALTVVHELASCIIILPRSLKDEEKLILCRPILGSPVNRPKLARNARWNSDAITVANHSLLQYSPTRIFVNKNDTWYVATDTQHPILSGNGVNGTPMTIGHGLQSLFVADNGDMYTYDDLTTDITMQSANTNNSVPVMIIGSRCEDLFVSTNNTMYCSIREMNQVVTKSLGDPTNTFSIVAGTGCYGTTSDMLAQQIGIFVDLSFSLYVADSENSRIQRFLTGDMNAITLAGDTAPGTIHLDYPVDVVLDGEGYLFIVDADNNRIIGSGPHGFRCVAVCTNTSGSASNQLMHPQSMSFDSDGNIWVADTGNDRLQKFTLNTVPPGTFKLHSHGDEGSSFCLAHVSFLS